jgi:uncharacterized membrane protein YjjP (DUF1212 family)
MLDSTRPAPQVPLQVGSAVTLLLADWGVHAANIVTSASHFWLVDVLGAFFAAVAVMVFEQGVGKDRAAQALIKALAAAIIVAFPLPVLGTLTALVALAWYYVVDFMKKRAA